MKNNEKDPSGHENQPEICKCLGRELKCVSLSFSHKISLNIKQNAYECYLVIYTIIRNTSIACQMTTFN